MHVKLVLPGRSRFDASPSSFVSELEQDRQSLLFGENTVEVHPLSSVACEETTIHDLILRVIVKEDFLGEGSGGSPQGSHPRASCGEDGMDWARPGRGELDRM